MGESPKCLFCDAIVPKPFENCGAMFHAVLEREYSDPAFGAAHLLTVDAYALQHSEEHGPRSNAFHLMRLCWLLVHSGDPGISQIRKPGRTDVREQSYRAFPFLAPPKHRGDLTVLSVVAAKTPQEQAEKVRLWAESVWNAWSIHHAWARSEAVKWGFS